MTRRALKVRAWTTGRLLWPWIKAGRITVWGCPGFFFRFFWLFVDCYLDDPRRP